MLTYPTPATPDHRPLPSLSRIVTIREGKVWEHALDWESALSRFDLMRQLYRSWEDFHISLENPHGVLVGHYERRRGRLIANYCPGDS
jgi:hypothetical protein